MWKKNVLVAETYMITHIFLYKKKKTIINIKYSWDLIWKGYNLIIHLQKYEMLHH